MFVFLLQVRGLLIIVKEVTGLLAFTQLLLGLLHQELLPLPHLHPCARLQWLRQEDYSRLRGWWKKLLRRVKHPVTMHRLQEPEQACTNHFLPMIVPLTNQSWRHFVTSDEKTLVCVHPVKPVEFKDTQVCDVLDVWCDMLINH